MKRFKLSCLALTVAALSFSTIAVAADPDVNDVKTFPGSICKALDGSQQRLVGTISGQLYVKGSAASQNTARINCPIIEDVRDGGVLTVNIFLNHPSDRLTRCRFIARDEFGSEIFQTATADGVGNKILSFNIPQSNNQQTSTFNCDLEDGRPLLPGEGGATTLLSYRTVEQ